MADIFKIYAGDYSKDGYDKGIRDAKNGNPKNKFKFFKVANPINYLWNFNNAYDTFMKNYDKGYIDGQRVVNKVYTNQTKGAIMYSENYAYHLQLLQALERSLSSIQGHIADIEEKYKRQIEAMKGAGFFDDYINPLKERYEEYRQKMKNLQEMIDRHKAKIELHKEAIENLQYDARG